MADGEVLWQAVLLRSITLIIDIYSVILILRQSRVDAASPTLDGTGSRDRLPVIHITAKAPESGHGKASHAHTVHANERHDVASEPAMAIACICVCRPLGQAPSTRPDSVQ
jgi:hypothetical protein